MHEEVPSRAAASMTGLPHTRGGSSSGEELPPERAAVEPPRAALGPATEAGGRGVRGSAGEGPFSRPTGSTAEDPPSGQLQAPPLASRRSSSNSGALNQAGGKAQAVAVVEPPLFSWAQLQAPAGSELVVLGGLLAVVPIVLSLLSRALALVS